MNKRIEKIVSYIEDEDKVIDVGCDQALLGEYLAKKNIFSIASDIRENIILNAKSRIIKLNLEKFIKFIVTDGLANTNDEDYDTVILSGMGTFTILNILANSSKKHKKIITISNNNHDILRIEMQKLGYIIKNEEIIYEKGKYYNLIIFIPGTFAYSKEDIIIGKNHQNIILLNEKLKIELDKLKKVYKNNKSEETKERINIIEKKLNCH